MKRLSFILISLGLSTTILAAMPAATDPSIINIPHLPGGFLLGGSLFYLQPSAGNGDLNFAALNTAVSSDNPTLVSSEEKAVEPSYSWGWGVNVGYIFQQTGNDINLSYFNLDTDDTKNVAVLNDTQSISSINATGLGSIFQNAQGEAQYNISQVDLTAGQYIDVGCRLILHPLAGLRWAEVERTTYDGFVFQANPNIISANIAEGIKDDSDYSGIGPLLGLDSSYYLGMGFGVVGHVDSAALIGSITDKQDVVEQINFIPSPSIGENVYTNTDNTRRMVPVVDAKLGLDYTYVANNTANSDITLEVGWQFSKYFVSVDKLKTKIPSLVVDPNAMHAPANGIQPNTFKEQKTSTVGLNGPYVNLVLHF